MCIRISSRFKEEPFSSTTPLSSGMDVKGRSAIVNKALGTQEGYMALSGTPLLGEAFEYLT